ncbi:unnamed protein product [Spirodela intermedia]|uniref:Uncharacterized protein n=1 Tax=Spirodela intermedia TaxID=51605 RepID=A0A7I8ICE8_SPIIN|nr:unnamed protein product [Spirodela intermedia]CAA6654722.1 unnamed protein product [Spirodela intermedia]
MGSVVSVGVYLWSNTSAVIDTEGRPGLVLFVYTDMGKKWQSTPLLPPR